MVRRIADRYMPGEDLDDAIATLRDLNREGCIATVDVLGESTESEYEATEYGSVQAGLRRAR